MAKLYEAKEGDKPIVEDIARLIIADKQVEVKPSSERGRFSRARCADRFPEVSDTTGRGLIFFAS